MNKLLLFTVLSCIFPAIHGMEQDRFKNVTRTRGSKPKKEAPSKKEMKKVTMTRGRSSRGHTRSFNNSPIKRKDQEPIFDSIAFDNAINRGDVKTAYTRARTMRGYFPATLLLKAHCKPQEKINSLIDKYVLPAQINEEKFKVAAQKLSVQRTQKLLGKE